MSSLELNINKSIGTIEASHRKSKKYLGVTTVILAGYLLLFTENTWVINLTLLLTFLCFGELIISLGKILPIKEITNFLMVLQLLFTPYLDYVMLKPFRASMMVVDQARYFEYALPAVLAFIIAMKIFPGKYHVDINSAMQIDPETKKNNRKTGIVFLLIGYTFLLFHNFFSFPGLDFLFVILSLFRFIGIFYLWFSDSRYKLLYMLMVLVPTTLLTIKGSVFIDLVIWFFFIYAFAAMKFKIKTVTTLIVVMVSLFLIMVVQSVKTKYRTIEWRSANIEKSATGLDLFSDLFSNSLQNIDERSLMMMKRNLIIRLNQGWIVSYVLRKDVPNTSIEKRSFFYDEVIGILLPRFLYENKATVGDNKKFRYLTGIPLRTSVAMNVGILGDGYGNFGYWGGIFFCFCFGLFLNMAMRFCFRLSHKYASLLFWMPLIFFYAMRAGNEFYIITNWIVKVSIVVFVYFYFFRSKASSKSV